MLGLHAGCSDLSVETTGGGLWQGELVAVPGAGGDAQLFGPVSMTSTGTATQITIQVFDAPANTALGWLVREGTCDGDGALIAPAQSFPFIETDASGEGSAQPIISGGLVPHEEYAAGVFSDTGFSALLACADLKPVT